ncbi:uncharacterized protein I206_100218 [Kwoniella pini CBS 10737]|uniref:DNA mismatch repair protein PMS2 n=1 Tax=Kwoniella pini CBS 10737 TaxID=1296096 RepID=A0A1B9IET0_9TREE|nr:uncharacterized protein I206_01107 [Kwoniella pini CBS 10737]OCF53800.1 hypothetical protein I206_01107 [Kwoniella pini CBS 10737]
MGGSIKAIDTESVHRIHSGQVILDLQGAIKELVENSLDAGATSIDVRIKDNGLDSIEIADNGSGIAESDWEYIALKHHTSKLPSLSDLYKVTTFGFRGEALSALCALCENVTVVTSTKESAPMGAIIKLGRDGRVTDSSGRIARPRGTTITLTGLFVPLPVRRKEFERTVKRELTKALTLLTAYALVPASVSLSDGRNGVRLKVESIAAGKTGKRNVQLSTDGRGSLRASVSAVWGHKALEGVQDIDLELEVDIDRVMARREGISETTQIIKVVGLISSAQWGQGRSSADRQFYFTNGRPCNLTSVARAINEVYKTFNTHQVPMAILDFQIPPQSLDINVSPDKRTIFVHSEDKLIETLKIALDEYFQPSRSTFAVGGATQTVKTIRQTQSQLLQYGRMSVDTTEPDVHNDSNNPEAEVEKAGPNQNEEYPQSMIGEDKETELDQEAADEIFVAKASNRSRSSPVIQIETESEGEYELSQPSSTGNSRPSRPSRPSSRNDVSKVQAPPLSVSRRVQQTLNTTKASWSPDKKSSSARAGPGPSTREARLDLRERLKGYASQNAVARDSDSEEESDDDAASGLAVDVDTNDDMEVDELESVASEPKEKESHHLDQSQCMEQDGEEEVIVMKSGRPPEEPLFEDDRSNSSTDTEVITARENVEAKVANEREEYTVEEDERPKTRRKSSSYRDEITTTTTQGEIKLSFNLPRLQLRFKSKGKNNLRQNIKLKNALNKVKEGALTDAAGLSNKNMQLAEEALNRVISKEDFNKMEVLGQFNKGFIIARLVHSAKINQKSEEIQETDDLFIIDQHASDEKYNFETLQRTTIIKGQALIKPRPLQLTASDEIIAIENLDILSKNGFDVKINEDALPGKGERINLISMPISKETIFDFKDLEQLLHLLSDNSITQGQMVRCSKARSMFAMRACRKSIMIGKSLTKLQMINLLKNMGTIDQPWNCPHGRPTMRHLIKIDKPTKSRSGGDRIDWKKWKRQQEI